MNEHDKQANKNKDWQSQDMDAELEIYEGDDEDDWEEYRDELDWRSRTQSQGGIYKNSGDQTII